MQYQDMHIGDRLQIGEAVLTLVDKSGRKIARFAIDADRAIPVNLMRAKARHAGYSDNAEATIEHAIP